MNVDQSLETLGLESKEIRVYKSLLEKGIASPTALSKSANVKRSTTYVVLDKLEEKGFVFQVPKENKKRYRPRNPEEIFNAKEEALDNAKDALPELQALSKQGDTKPHVLFFEGKSGIEEIMSYKLNDIAGDEITSFMCTTNQETVEKFDNFKKYNEKLKNHDISEREISPQDPSLPALAEHRNMDEDFNREVVEIPLEQFNSEVGIEIGNSWTKIYDFANLQGLIIENDSITNTLSQVFELLWKKLKKQESD